MRKSYFYLLYSKSSFATNPSGHDLPAALRPQKEKRYDALLYPFWNTNPLGISRSYAKI